MAIDFTNMTPRDAYTQGFHDGCKTDARAGKFSIRGYDLPKLMDIISDWEQRQPVTLFKTKDDRVKVERVGDSIVVWADGVQIHTSKRRLND